jgi:hypothetical protein
MRNYYKVLGIPAAATPLQIKKAYRKLVLQHHPDRNPGSTIAVEMLKMLNEAYEVLSDPEKKADYDRSRGLHREPSTPVEATGERLRPEASVFTGPGYGKIWDLDTYPVEVEEWPPVLKYALVIDMVVSVVFFLLTLRIMPPLLHVLQLTLVGVAAFFVKNKKRSNGLIWYFVGKYYLSMWLAKVIFALSVSAINNGTTERPLVIPIMVLLWNGFAAFISLIYKLDQELKNGSWFKGSRWSDSG